MSNSYFLSNWTGRGENLATPTASNLAQWFTPSVPMCGAQYDPERMIILADVPIKLKRSLEDGLEPIGIDCIKQNAT